MFLPVVVVFIGLQVCSATITADVACPVSCDCNHVMRNNQKHLLVTCYVHDLKSVDLSYLVAVPEPFALEMFCDSGVPYDISSDMFTSLKMMRELYLSHCKIAFIHRNAFTDLKLLRSIRINSATNFHLNVHHLAFDGIPQLQTFEMTGCGLLELPKLCSLRNLRVLNVSNNSLSTLKESGLVCVRNTYASLLVIDISNNRFKSLTEIGLYGSAFPKLEIFNAANNVISLSTEDLIFNQFPNLRIADLSNNIISELPDILLTTNTHLEDLNLSYNKITSIPMNFLSHLSYLIRLSLQYNALDDSVWSRLADTKYLMILDISGNFLMNINETAVQELTELTYLKLAHNKIGTIPVKTFQNQQDLLELTLTGNQIHTVDNDALYGLMSLSTLNLDNNTIYAMNVDLLNAVESIKYLNVSSNNLIDLPSLKKLSGLLVLDASNNHLVELPEDLFIAQRYVTDINLSSNRILRISDQLFKTCESLINLDISDNLIKFVHPSMFMGLKIEQLKLQDNRINNIGSSFASAKLLRQLNLSSNQISDTIKKNMFPDSLVMLDLSYNRLEHIRPNAFEGLDQIRLIDVRYNQISTLMEEALTVSTGTYAQTGFLIEENPLKCDCNLLWLKKWDQSTRGPIIVNINNTRCSGALDYPTAPVLSVPEERFLCYYDSICPPTCRCCGFKDGCDCKSTCPGECDCYTSADYYSVHYVRCSERNLSSVEKVLPRMATKIDMSGNELEILPSHSFLGVSNLSVLFLNSSNIKKIENRSFVGLVTLKRLYLDHNYIKALLTEMFVGLTSIEEIHLDHNYISVVQSGVFDQMYALKKLHLSNNYLQYMDDYLSHLVFTIHDLTLFSNPWSCDCIMYFSAKENPVAYMNVSADASGARTINCTVPTLKGLSKITPLYDYGRICEGERPRYIPEGLTRVGSSISNSTLNTMKAEHDTGSDDSVIKSPVYSKWNLQIVIPVMVGATFLIIMLISIVCRKDFVKCWLFTKYRCKSSDSELLYDKTRHYDAFVCYHPRDEIYVIRELAFRLEHGKSKYHLLVHHRDWPPCSSVTQFIENGIKSSHRTVLVLTNDFIQENSWIKYVTNCVKQDSIRRLIVITIGKIDKSKLDPVLRSYLQTDKHICYGERWFWEKLFYCLPEPGKVERSIARAEAHPYASTDLAKLSSAMRDNQAYEEPTSTLCKSMTSRPLPTVTEYVPSSSSHSYDYAAGSQNGSNIYEEINERENTCAEEPERKYDEPWKDIVLPVDLNSSVPEPVHV